MALNKNKKVAIIIFIVIIFASVIFTLSKSFSVSNILKRSKESIWLDKSGRYAIIVSTIANLDSCNTLSIITRTQDFKRLDCISKIGDNDQFIIEETKNTQNIVQYWIINKDKDKPELPSNQIVEGPLSLTKFADRKKELKIDSLSFQKDF
jgi:uncharacterized membrane protein YheB (UPF0754 family)